MVFDTSNLFAVDKFSGYDRIEGGGRANVGVQARRSSTAAARSTFCSAHPTSCSG
jgi:lipopolysaccharide assembly outer membrane protein LptD (OstA)